MNCKIAILVLLIVGLCLESAAAQTEKTHRHKDMQGQTVESPYITYSEFQNISINGQAKLRDILTVSSIEDVVNILGDPRSTEVVEVNAGNIKEATTLIYEGMKFTYVHALDKERLETMEVTSPDIFVKIGDKKVYPNLHIRSMTKEVYNRYIKSKNI